MNRPVLKRVARAIVLIPMVNRVVVAILSLLPDWRWKTRCPVVGDARLNVAGGEAVHLLRADRCHVAREVFWGEGALASAADRRALELAVRLGSGADIFVDIGAYSGLFALAVARGSSGARCHAYEIVPENFQLLWANIIRNDLVTRIEPNLVGIGAQQGVVRVPAALGLGSLASSIALDFQAEDGVRVPVDTLDSRYCDFTGRMVMKLDVEGFEWSVLRGGDALIRRVRPDMICEVLRRATEIPAMQEYLTALGYHLYQIVDAGLSPRTRIEPTKHERDWLFTTRSAADLGALGINIVDAQAGVAA